jgi:hypothetical protein
MDMPTIFSRKQKRQKLTDSHTLPVHKMIASEPSQPEPSSQTAVVANHKAAAIDVNRDTAPDEDFYQRLRAEASQVLQDEPEMEQLLRRTVLAPHVQSFEDAVIQTLCHRLLLPSSTELNPNSYSNGSDVQEQGANKNDLYPMSPQGLRKLIRLCMDSDMEEKGCTFSEAIRKDAMAVVERDPATESILEVILFAKG